MFEESVSSLPSILASMNSWFTPTVLFVLLNLMIGTIAITSGLSTQKHHEQRQQQQQHEPPQENPHHRQLARSPSMLQRLKSINFYSYRSQEPTTGFHKAPESENIHAFRQTEQQEHPQFTRSPSILQRLKSINLQNFISQDSTPKHSSSTDTLHKTQEPETHFHFHFPQTLQQQQPKEDVDEQKQKEEQQQELVEDEQIPEDQYQDEEADQLQTLDEIYNQFKGGPVSRTKSDTEPTSGEVPTKLSRKMKKSASAKSAFAHFEEHDVVESRRPATVREGKAAKATEVDDEVDAKADDFINKFKQQLKLQRLDSIIRYKETVKFNRGSAK